MTEKTSIEHAIAVLASQRLALGASVVDTTIGALEERLLSLSDRDTRSDDQPRVRQEQSVTKKHEARFTGRAAKMHQLQEMLRRTVTSGEGLAVSISGEAGIGKSRLIHELEIWAGSLSHEILFLRGRSDQRLSQRPYALVQDLLATHFGIKDADPAAEVQGKLKSGLAKIMGQDRERAQGHGRVLGALLGVSAPARIHEETSSLTTPKAAKSTLSVMVDLIKASSATYPAVVVILEDFQWADSQSIDLIRELVVACRRLPFLLISLTRSRSASQLTPLSGSSASPQGLDSEANQQTIVLVPLSDGDSRRLVTEIASPLPEPPQELCDFVVERAHGNPLFIEEFVNLLIADGISENDDFQWRLRPSGYGDGRIPLSLNGLLTTRIARLSVVERYTLQRAAVMGNVFWDRAVIHLGAADDADLSETEALEAVRALERKGLVRRRSFSFYPGTHEYAFKSATLRDVAYATLLARQRQRYHRLAAGWLAKHSRRLLTERMALIADHYRQSGESNYAAELYETAASRARTVHNLVSAIDFTREALSILTAEQHHAPWQLRLKEQLGDMLRRQARLVEATQAYLAMEYISKEDGDLGAQARALNGTASACAEQADYEQMLEKAKQAKQVALLTGSAEELATAHLHEAEAYWNLGKVEPAEAAARQALERGRNNQLENKITASLSFLCSLHISLGNQEKSAHYLRLLQKQSSRLQTANSQKKDGAVEQFAVAQISLGKLHRTMGEYGEAADAFHRALKLSNRTDHFAETAEALDGLGETARMWGNASTAAVYHRRAVSIALSTGDELSAMRYRTNLAEALIGVGQNEDAVTGLRCVIRLAEDRSRSQNWPGLSRALCLLAQAQARQGQHRAALANVRRARELAQRQSKTTRDHVAQALVWRALGDVAAAMPAPERFFTLDDVSYDAPACFSMSVHVLDQAGSITVDSYRAMIETYHRWCAYEDAHDNRGRVDELRAEVMRVEWELETWLKAWAAQETD